MKAGSWQPIETAPRDGSRILVWSARTGRTNVAKWDDDSFAKHPKPYWELESYRTMDARQRQPTHWMPMPAAPIAPKEKA